MKIEVRIAKKKPNKNNGWDASFEDDGVDLKLEGAVDSLDELRRYLEKEYSLG